MTPYFKTFSDFLAMGGHGFYVWLCYGITFAALFGLIIFAKNERKNTLKKLGRQQSGRLTNKQRKHS